MGASLKLADRFALSMAKNAMRLVPTFSQLTGSTKFIASNLKDATMSLLKWGGLAGMVSGLLGAGGLWGINRMAAGVSEGQTQSRRTGSTYGQNKAAELAYGQMFGGAGGVQSMLEKIAYAQKNFGRTEEDPAFMARMGMGGKEYMSMSSTDVLQKMMLKAQGMLKAQPKGSEMAYASSTGLTNNLPADVLMQLSNMQVKEVESLNAALQARQRELNLSQGTQSAWSNFNRTIETSKEVIENTFIKALSPLIPALTSFSSSLSEAIKTVLGNKHISGWVTDAGKGIENFASYLTTPKFKADVEWFLDAVDTLAGAIYSFAKKVLHFVGSFGGAALKGSDYQRADTLRKDNKELGDKYQAMLENPNSERYNKEFGIALNEAMKGSNAHKVAEDLTGARIENQEMANYAAKRAGYEGITLKLKADPGMGYTLALVGGQ